MARKVTTEYAQVKADVDLLDSLTRQVQEAQEYFDLGMEESDDSVEAEVAR